MLRMFRRTHLARAISSILKPSDITSGITIISGGGYSGNPAINAFDGNISTMWIWAGIGSPWIGKHYPSSVIVNKATVQVGNNYYLYGYKIEYSDDGVTWNIASNITGISVSFNGTHTTSFATITAKYWRFVLTNASHTGNIGISEVIFDYQ